MLRKRIIFTLLYSDGFFVLSRNFRLQKVGDLNWLEENYSFSNVSQYIDELIILDVSRGEKNNKQFSNIVRHISDSCFVPVAAGGGIDSLEKARGLMEAGADKIVLNSNLFDKDLVNKLAETFGKQSIIGSIDVASFSCNNLIIATHNGSIEKTLPVNSLCKILNDTPLGEVYINSMTNDGTGCGLDIDLLETFGNSLNIPIILTGGIGNKIHVQEGLTHMRIDAVATAHLFNFIGNGLSLTRQYSIDTGISLPTWPSYESIFKKIS